MDRLSTKGSIIDQIDIQNASRSGFDRSFHNYLSCTLGKIVPTRVEEVLPGDRIKGSTHIVANFEPLVAPILGNMVLKQETFYVPQSILWKHAHEFFTGKKGFEGKVPLIHHQTIYDYLTERIGASQIRMIPWLDFRNYLVSAWPVDAQPYNFERLVANGYWHELLDVFYGDLDDIISSWSEYIEEFATTHYVADLMKPYTRIIRDFKYGEETINQVTTHWLGNPSFTDEQQVQYLIDFWVSIFDWWFGPSSHMDYMGVGFYYCRELITRFINSLTYDADPDDILEFPKISFSWLPFRAAYSIWYWNYRDQLLESDVLDAEEFMESDVYTQNEVILLLLSRQRCWFKDTFTTALTNTGNGNILIPSLAQAYSLAATSMSVGSGSQYLNATSDRKAAIDSGADIQSFTIGGVRYSVPSNYLVKPVTEGSEVEQQTNYYVSLDLIDRAKRLSTWISKRLVTGVEYDDVLYTSFMVKLSHVRMRVPELLDAGRSTVAINTVVNNTTIPDAQVAGDKSAIAWAENNSDGVNYFAEEHGYLLSFMTILPIQSYAGGIDRMYLRQNRFDFAWPEFSTMGLDAVYNCELALPYGGGQADTAALMVFGYQGRYYDYKSKLDEEHGRMRTDLNYMTFTRDFDLHSGAKNPPLLNYEFVHCWPSLDMFVTDDPNVDVVRSVDIAHNYHWERVLPVPSEILR